MEQNNQQNRNQNNGMKRPRFNFTWLYILLIAGMLFSIFFRHEDGATSREMDYTHFQELVTKGYVSSITVNRDNLSLAVTVDPSHNPEVFGVKDKKKSQGNIKVNVGSLDNLQDFIDNQTEEGNFKGKVKYEHDSGFLSNFIWNFAPLIIILLIWFFIFRRMGGGGMMGGGIFSVGKSKAQVIDGKQDGKDAITFKDVAGQAGAKQEVQEIVDFLKKPDKYTNLGGKIPKGALLVGPPGTGKTLLAKAVAGEAGVPFFSLSGSEFVEMFVGVGASRVRDLFQQAKAKAPCIIFIDEIDAIGRARSKSASMGGNDERESTLNQLLTEMDGFGTNSGIIIMAATNRADILDKALLRAGRFDRQIHVDLPDLNERKEIFMVHLKPLKIDETVDVDQLARQTPGFSGADIANVCNEAALIAARNNKKWVDKQCFLDAVDRIIGGLEKKTKLLTVQEKRTIALHEAGHATISWFLQYANPLVKVTIVPRGQALGAAWYMPEERMISTKEQLCDELCSLLGGRAAEELCVGHISSGAANDLERATKMSHAMIAFYGMGDKLPNLCYYSNDEYSFSKPYSDHTAQLIDEEVKSLIASEYARAKKVLTENKEGHAQLAQLLIDREVIFAEDLERIFGPRPWASRSDELLTNDENAEESTSEVDQMASSHRKENEEIIRQKIVQAVVEKAEMEKAEKEGKADVASSDETGTPQEEQKH